MLPSLCLQPRSASPQGTTTSTPTRAAPGTPCWPSATSRRGVRPAYPPSTTRYGPTGHPQPVWAGTAGSSTWRCQQPLPGHGTWSPTPQVPIKAWLSTYTSKDTFEWFSALPGGFLVSAWPGGHEALPWDPASSWMPRHLGTFSLSKEIQSCAFVGLPPALSFRQGGGHGSYKQPPAPLPLSRCLCSWSTWVPARCSCVSYGCTAAWPHRRSPTPAAQPQNGASPRPRRKSSSWRTPGSRATQPPCRAAW